MRKISRAGQSLDVAGLGLPALSLSELFGVIWSTLFGVFGP